MTADQYYEQERGAALDRDGYICQGCGQPANQTAHMIPRRGWLCRMYGRRLIDSRHNLRASCEKCNPALQARVAGPAALARAAAEVERLMALDK